MHKSLISGINFCITYVNLILVSPPHCNIHRQSFCTVLLSIYRQSYLPNLTDICEQILKVGLYRKSNQNQKVNRPI